MKIILTKNEQSFFETYYKNIPKEFNLIGNIHFKKDMIDVIFNEIFNPEPYYIYCYDNFGPRIVNRKYPYMIVNKKNISMFVYDCEERMNREKKI